MEHNLMEFAVLQEVMETKQGEDVAPDGGTEGRDAPLGEKKEVMKAVQIECAVGVLVLVADVDLVDVELETPPARSRLGGGCSASQTNHVDHTVNCW